MGLDMYTTIIHPLRKALNLSLTEYCVLESIRELSDDKYNGWCVASKQTIAKGLDITRQYVHKTLKVLETKDLIEISDKGFLRITHYYNELLNK